MYKLLKEANADQFIMLLVALSTNNVKMLIDFIDETLDEAIATAIADYEAGEDL